MPMKETGKQSSEGSAPLCEQPGTSRDAVEPAGQNLSCNENSSVSLVPKPKKVSYSTELFSTWRDIRWFQIPLSSLRRPKAGLFSFRFQTSLQEYQQLRKTKRLKVGRPFSVLPFPNLSVTLSDCSQKTLYKQHGKLSGTGRVKSCKSSSARRAAPAASVPARPPHHLQLHHQCLTILPTTDTCDCEDRNIATAQNPAGSASGGNCPGLPCVVLHRIHQKYWDCCHWNKMSLIPPGPQHCLQSSHHCKRQRSATLHASDVCGSENSSIAKAEILKVGASQVNSVFTERVTPGPSSMQPHVHLHRICLAQDGCETAPQDWDELRPHAHQLCTEEPTLMQPRVLLRRICLAQDRREIAPRDWGEPRPPEDQSQTETLMPMQPRVLLHRLSLVQDQCRTALEDWDEPRPCDNQLCTEEVTPTEPRVVLRRVCLDQCRTAPKDRDEPRRRENWSCAEELNPKQPRVLLRRVCLDQGETASEDRDEPRHPGSQPGAEKLIPMQPRVLLRRISLAQVQGETMPQDRDEPRLSDHQAGAEKTITVAEELSSSAHTGEDGAESEGASLAMEQPFSSPSADQPPTAPPAAHAKEAKPRRGGIQRHWRHSSSHLHLANLKPRGSSQQRCSKRQKCSSPACSLSKRFVFSSGAAKQRQNGRTRSRPRKKQRQGARGRSEQGLASDPPAHSHLFSPASSAVVTDMTGSNEGTSAWGNASSPLEEEEDDDDMFPADWTPPRVEFLYYDDPPPLSPAPGPASESRSSGEMPDITEEVFGPQVMEFTPKATSSTQSPQEILNQAAATDTKHVALGETEKRDVAGLEHLEPSFCQLANEELEGALLVGQAQAKNWTAFGTGCSPLSSPIHSPTTASRVSSRNSISMSSPNFAEDPDKLDLEFNLMGEVDLEHPPSPYCYHSSMATPRISSRSSISASSDGFAGDPEKQLPDSDVKRDPSLESTPSQFPTHPLLASSNISSRSSISAFSGEFVGDPVKMTLDSDMERDMDPESPPSELSTHPLITASPTVSSRSSSSTSFNKLSGEPEGMAPGSDMEEDMDDSGLISLADLLQTDDMNQSSVELSTFLSSGPDGYLSSLDKLLEEKREQIQDEELERSQGEKLLLSTSLHSMEVFEENEGTSPEVHRFLLKRFSISQGTIPSVHPGESIFGPLPHLKTALALDTAGLMPQNELESLFFSYPFDQQMVLLQDGFLTFLYCGGKFRCPCPVRRWLFQLMSLNSEVSADAFQALWEITTHQVVSNDEVNLWFPTLKDITQAFCHLGACAFALYPAGLVQLEFKPKGLEFSEHLLERAKMKSQNLLQEGSGQLTLAAMLGDIFKFLTLCVASHPHGYPDHQRLAFLAVLCRLSLDRSLQKQPLLELQQLLLVLLEGIQGWQEKVLELCKSLCHVSQHHHNLVAIICLFPDTTDRGRQLRRNLSLSFITKLLGKMQMATSPWQEDIQLQKLGHLLPLMKPAFLKQNLLRLQKDQDGNMQQAALAELDQEACYLCYTLLTLANVVVGTQVMPSSKQGPLQNLCTQLQQHIGVSIREDPCIMYRTQLKNLVAQTYVKWQELLSQSWLQGQS